LTNRLEHIFYELKIGGIYEQISEVIGASVTTNIDLFAERALCGDKKPCADTLLSSI